MDTASLITFINATGFVGVYCHRELDPKQVQILFPFGIGLSLPYDTYEQIRAAAGLPEGVCNMDNTSG